MNCAIYPQVHLLSGPRDNHRDLHRPPSCPRGRAAPQQCAGGTTACPSSILFHRASRGPNGRRQWISPTHSRICCSGAAKWRLYFASGVTWHAPFRGGRISDNLRTWPECSHEHEWECESFSFPLLPFVPDTSVVQQLPSKSPYSHLPPVNKQSGPFTNQIPPCSPLKNALLYLVGLQLAGIAGQPLHQITGNHVAWTAGKRWVGRAGVLQLLPLPNAIHCPALSETGSENHITAIMAIIAIIVATSGLPLSSTPESESRGKLYTGFDLLPPPEVTALEMLVVNLH